MAAPHGALRNLAPTNPCPGAVASDGRPWRRSGPPGRSGAASRQSTTRPRSAATLPAGLHRTSAPPYRGLPIATTQLTRDETAVTGRTADTTRLDAGRVGHESAGQLRPDEGARWPDTGRAGHRTAGHLDHGRRPGSGGHPSSGHRLAMDSRQPSWHLNHCDEDPTAGRLSTSSAGQTSRGPIRNQDSSAVKDPAGSWPPPRQTGVGDPPPSSRRLGTLLSAEGVGGDPVDLDDDVGRKVGPAGGRSERVG
jgi:hypothetical protein